MLIYHLTKYSDNYSKTCGSLWQYHRDEPQFDNNGAIADFPADNNNSTSFKFQTKIAGRKRNDGTKNVNVRVPLKYLSNFWRTFEMPLINCEFNLILTCSATCFIIDAPIANNIPTFTITDTKLCVPVVTLSTQDNEKLLQELKSGSKRIINWKKCELKVIVEQQNQYFDFLINPSFQGVNRFFVLSFENNGGRTSYTRYYLPLGEIKDYNVMIDGQHFCNQPAKNYLITYENI